MNKRIFKVFSFVAILALMLVALPMQSAQAAPTSVFINEIHYDNTGTDAGEAIEVAGPAGTDLTGWSLVLYNGNGGVYMGPQLKRYHSGLGEWLWRPCPMRAMASRTALRMG